MRYLFVLAAAIVSVSANALLVDGFIDGNLSLFTNGSSTVANDYRAATVFGGSRATILEQTATGGASPSNVTINNNSLTLSTPVGAFAQVHLGYGAVGVSGTSMNYVATGNYSFGTNDTIKFNFAGSDRGLWIRIDLYDGGFQSTVYEKTVAGNQLSPFSVNVGNADLVTSSTASFNNFDLMRVIVRTEEAGDMRLNSIEAVPEPATLTALAVGGLALLRRRSRGAR